MHALTDPNKLMGVKWGVHYSLKNGKDELLTSCEACKKSRGSGYLEQWELEVRGSSYLKQCSTASGLPSVWLWWTKASCLGCVCIVEEHFALECKPQIQSLKTHRCSLPHVYVCKSPLCASVPVNIPGLQRGGNIFHRLSETAHNLALFFCRQTT